MTEEERLREFLLAIHMDQGKVCPDYDTCQHVACASNHATWELADAALQGMTLEQYRQEKARITTLTSAGLEGAIALKCFKCGAVGVIKNPGPGAYPECKECKSKDVVVMDVDVLGGYSYETTLGGEITAPWFDIVSIRRRGSC